MPRIWQPARRPQILSSYFVNQIALGRGLPIQESTRQVTSVERSRNRSGRWVILALSFAAADYGQQSSPVEKTAQLNGARLTSGRIGSGFWQISRFHSGA